MNNIILNGTPKTPDVNFSAEEGRLEIKGRSIPENSIEFYSDLLAWIDEYATNPKTTTVMDMKLEYFNTSSSKCILDVFKKLEVIKKNGQEVVINWYYEEEDEDMLEAGEDYDAIIDIPFTMKVLEEV